MDSNPIESPSPEISITVDNDQYKAPSLHEVLVAHLEGCSQCSDQAYNGRPVGLGQKPRMCDEWFGIIQEYADYEGEVNNVVRKTEYMGTETGPDVV